MEYDIIMASENDRDEILNLYKTQVGREFCPWTEDYPSDETINDDLSRDALFVMKMNGRICAAISIDEEEEVDGFPIMIMLLQNAHGI